MRIGAPLVAVLAALLAAAPLSAQSQRPQGVDLELAFVVDASGSIDEDETRLQRQGYADALLHPRVQRAIKGGFLRSIAVAYIEFAGDGCTRMSVPWTRIHDTGTATAFGTAILSSPPMFCPGGNAISEAVGFAAATIKSNGFEGTRRVIDVSGDGPNTLGEPIELVRDIVVRDRIIINALAINRPSFPDLPDYYRVAVTGGPGSFVIKAESRAAFAAAILRKMIREIANIGPGEFKRQTAQRVRK
jgi:hypothetical protein